MCLSLMRTEAGEIKYAVFNVLNRFQTYSNSIDCTVTTFDVSLCNFFFHNVQIFFTPFLGSTNLFSQILSLPPPPPPPTRSPYQFSGFFLLTNNLISLAFLCLICLRKNPGNELLNHLHVTLGAEHHVKDGFR